MTVTSSFPKAALIIAFSLVSLVMIVFLSMPPPETTIIMREEEEEVHHHHHHPIASSVGVTQHKSKTMLPPPPPPPPPRPLPEEAVSSVAATVPVVKGMGTSLTNRTLVTIDNNSSPPPSLEMFLSYLPRSIRTIPWFHSDNLRPWTSGRKNRKKMDDNSHNDDHGNDDEESAVVGRRWNSTTVAASAASTFLHPIEYMSHHQQQQHTSNDNVVIGTCVNLRRRDVIEYDVTVARLLHDVKDGGPPLYKLPWYYHDPFPLCGRYLLRYYQLIGTERGGGGGSNGSAPATSSSSGLLRPGGGRGSTQAFLPRLGVSPSSSGLTSTTIIGSGLKVASITVESGKTVNRAVWIENCGSPSSSSAASDVLITARLVSDDVIIAANVMSPKEAAEEEEEEGRKKKKEWRSDDDTSSHQRQYISFTTPSTRSTMGREYILEVKVVHLNGSSSDPTHPKSLGVIGTRASDHNRKSFKYNVMCDLQRHVYGSPLHVRVIDPSPSSSSLSSREKNKKRGDTGKQEEDEDENNKTQQERKKMNVPRTVPFCKRANHTHGKWVRVTSPTMCNSLTNSPFCYGNPKWLSDACGYNIDMVWVPTEKEKTDGSDENDEDDGSCRYKLYTPPRGPTVPCLIPPETMSMRSSENNDTMLRKISSSSSAVPLSAMLIVGDSVMREYGMNCGLFNLRDGGRLVCVFNNIALEGQHYSTSYAKDVSKAIIDAIVRNKAGIFATNLGIHHMIGPCTTAQWMEFVHVFVEEWKSRKVSRIVNGDANGTSPVVASASATVQKAVWISPPTIHYARKGMGYQRAVVWDGIAWSRLEPLGFVRLDAMAPTQSRTEGTWDGLHYASQKGKVQSPQRYKEAPIYPWNGGVSNMLFLMLLNLVCRQ